MAVRLAPSRSSLPSAGVVGASAPELVEVFGVGRARLPTSRSRARVAPERLRGGNRALAVLGARACHRPRCRDHGPDGEVAVPLLPKRALTLAQVLLTCGVAAIKADQWDTPPPA